MNVLEREAQVRNYIMDSLVARSGKTLSPDVIVEIATELLERMIDVHEVPLAIFEDIPQ